MDAGLAAEGARAFAEAVGHYRRALELWEQVSDSSAYLRLTVVARSRDEACAGRVRPVALCRLGPLDDLHRGAVMERPSITLSPWTSWYQHDRLQGCLTTSMRLWPYLHSTW